MMINSRKFALQNWFHFQSYNLIQQLTVLENIETRFTTKVIPAGRRKQRCKEFAELVGLGDRLGHRPAQLSGGQQQRVAIARSLINDPFFLLADEPTGNLDSVTSHDILDLFGRLNDEGRTIIMVTHEDEVAERSRRTIRLRDGLLQSDERLKEIESVRRDSDPVEQIVKYWDRPVEEITGW